MEVVLLTLTGIIWGLRFNYVVKILTVKLTFIYRLRKSGSVFMATGKHSYEGQPY